MVSGHLGFDELERILRRGDGFDARGLSGLRGYADGGDLGPADENLARTAADEAVAGELFAALDGFKEVGRAGGLELGVGGDGRLEVRHEVGVNGNDVALGGELQEVFATGKDVHG